LGPQDIARNKRLKSVAKSTPWLDDWELDQVGRSLTEARHAVSFSTTAGSGRKRQRLDELSPQLSVEEPLGSLQEALERMSVWKVRMDNRLPHAVESSYQLSQVRAHSLFLSSSSCVGTIIMSSVEQLRLAYSSAILRAINGLADAMQQQRIAAQSVAASCAKLGIPSWVVDIRHEATHNQMPNLSVLRLAAATLMDFFHKEYWQPRSLAAIISISTATVATTMEQTTTQDPDTSTLKEQQQQDDIVNTNDVGSNSGYEFPVSRSVTTDLLRDLMAYTMQQTKVMEEEMKSKSLSSPAGGTLKRKISSASTKKSSKKALSSKQQAFWVVAANQSGSSNDDDEDGSNDDDDDDDEMYLDGFNAPFSKSTLGTTTNRFAALQEIKSKNSKTKKKKQKTDKGSNGTSNNTKEKKKKKERSAHHHAKQFCKHGTHHLDRAYHIALLYLVWGGATTTSAETGDIPAAQQRQQSGALIPSDVVKFPDTDEGIRNARQLFSTLLIVLGKEWPGFLQTLIVHLVDNILVEERSLSSAAGATTRDGADTKEQSTAVQDDAHARRKLYFLESWVQYLVSRDFVAHFYADIKGTTRKKSAGVAAPWSFLQKMRYPLNGICDRLLLVSSSHDSDTEDKVKGAAATSRRLGAYFMDALGDHRISYYGVRFHGEPEVLSDGNEGGAGIASQAEQVASDTVMEVAGSLGQEQETKAEDSDNKAGFSLHEIESLLASGETTCEDSKDAGDCEPTSHDADPPPMPIAAEPIVQQNLSTNLESREKPRQAWVRCTLWEPCAIGAVPGYPCSS